MCATQFGPNPPDGLGAGLRQTDREMDGRTDGRPLTYKIRTLNVTVEFASLRVAAGSVMYEYGVRIGQEVGGLRGLQKQAKCYLATLNSLRLVDPKYAWIVKPVPSTAQVRLCVCVRPRPVDKDGRFGGRSGPRRCLFRRR